MHGCTTTCAAPRPLLRLPRWRHVAPLVLGGGTPLFPGDATVRLELLESEMTAYAQHLTYRVLADN
jgi:hypothetical protein